MSERLPPIPTPPSQMLRQLRLQYLPIIVFIIAVGLAAVIWARWVAPPTLVGEAETIRADVRSMKPGVLTNVKVTLLQSVKAGDVIAEVVTTDPKTVDASLAVIRAELDMIRFTMDPVMGQQRAALDYERLLLDVMKARVDLAALQAQLFQAQSTFERTNTLFASKLVTEEKFEEVKNARDALDAQVKAQNNLIARIEPGLKDFAGDGTPNGQVPTPAQGMRSAIAVQEQKLRLAEAQLGPIALVAPIDGIVSLAHRQMGETVAAGEPLFQISAVRSERIVGFLRPPLAVVPKPGTAVEIRTRTLPRKVSEAAIVGIGTQLEPITPTLLSAMHLPISSAATELGLRVHITTPAGLSLHPGEQVDVIVRD